MHVTRLAFLRLTAIGMVLLLATTGCSGEENGLVERTNAARASAGRSPVQANLTLWFLAGAQSIRMADEGRISHSDLGPGNNYPWRALAENVGRGASPDQVFDALMGSSGHRNNILYPNFNYIGVGVVNRSGTYWITQQFMWL